jgi:hypothetical protein
MPQGRPAPEEITNLYLYGTETTPENKATQTFVRPEDVGGVPAEVDVTWFMSEEGPGRFASPATAGSPRLPNPSATAAPSSPLT